MNNFLENEFAIPASAYPAPMILDTDTYNEIDDQFALIYSIVSPDKIDFRGVTAAPFFNSRSTGAGDGMEKSYQEICRILDIMKCSQSLPAKRGATQFLPDRHTPVDSEAARFIISQAKLAQQENKKLFVTAIGAITNVASAILLAPEIVDQIVVVWLGGHEINHTENREFNLQGDIPAAQVVFSSQVPLIQIPCCHVASALTTNEDELQKQLVHCSTPGEYLKEIFIEYVHENNCPNKVIWDISAVAYLVIPAATQWEIVPRPLLADDCSWHENPAGQPMLRAKKIAKEQLFDDLFGRLRRWVTK